jgi:ribonuclease-3
MRDGDSALEEAQRALRIRFQDPGLLAEAFVHRSVLNETGRSPSESNERLEFLGDAILGAVVAKELFLRYPQATEGDLTVMRAALVQRAPLAEAARRLGLGQWLQLGRGEEQSGGRDRAANLSRVYEALIGAIYLDKKNGLKSAGAFIRRTLKPEFAQLGSADLADPKSRLQWVVQSRWQEPPVYELVDERGPAHDRTFRVRVSAGGTVVGEGTGSSRRRAEQAAAAAALKGFEEADA